VIREMTRLAMKHGSAVNLSQFPDFAAPRKSRKRRGGDIRRRINQYAR
jgi:hypothetical protein